MTQDNQDAGSPPPASPPKKANPGAAALARRKPTNYAQRKKRPKLSKSLYDSILNAYRREPGNHSAAERATGFGRKACRMAWELGWAQKDWAKPIREVLQAELDEARTKAAEKAQREADAQSASLEAKRRLWEKEVEEEILMVGAMRKAVLGTAAIVNGMSKAVHQLSLVVARTVLNPDGTPNPNPTIKAPEAMKVISQVAQVLGRLSYAGSVLVDLGATNRGERENRGEAERVKGDPKATRESLRVLAELNAELEAEEERKAAKAAEPPAVH